MTPALAKDVPPDSAWQPDDPADALDGRLEYECRTSIRALKNRYGPEGMREMVAMYINDEMAGRRQ